MTDLTTSFRSAKEATQTDRLPCGRGQNCMVDGLVSSARFCAKETSAVYKTDKPVSQAAILQQLAHMIEASLVPGLVSVCEDAELREVVAAWGTLPSGVRTGIVALIRASLSIEAE